MLTALALATVLAGWPQPQAVFMSSQTASPSFGMAQTVNLSHIAPPNAKAVNLTGLLIVTHGNAPELCDLKVWFRPSADYRWGDYMGQAIEPFNGGGERVNHSITIPLVNNSFQIWVDPLGPGWPSRCSYAVNYKVNEWKVEEFPE